MNFCGPYDKQLAEQYRPSLVTPLLGGWEFWQKSTSLEGQSSWLAMANERDWVLPKTIRATLRSSNLAVVITDTDQHIQYVNDRFEQMTGYTYQDALGKRPNFLQGQATSPLDRQRIREAIAQQKSVSGRLLNYRKDKTPYWCQVKIRPIMNRQKQVVNFIAFEQEVPANEHNS